MQITPKCDLWYRKNIRGSSVVIESLSGLLVGFAQKVLTFGVVTMVRQLGGLVALITGNRCCSQDMLKVFLIWYSVQLMEHFKKTSSKNDGYISEGGEGEQQPRSKG